MPTPTKHSYISFLMRLSRLSDPLRWRVTLVNPNSGERHSFRTLTEAFEFLTDLTGDPGPERDEEQEE